MLLIDADNVSAEVIEQAVHRTLDQHGAIHVRRAYCNVETAQKLQGLFKRLSIRPMVNISAGKNSTDIALAVDAIDTVVAERPDLVVLVSSDSDFAPLVIRLREKGCRVCGFGQRGKTGDDTVDVYDEFIDLAHRPAADRGDAAAPRAPAAQAAPRPRAARKTRRSKAPDLPPAPELPEDVLRILEAIPELAGGGKMELNQAAEQLRAEKLLGKSASSLKLFKKHPELFELSPQQKPHKVQYVGPMTA
ncbi:conserved hypothetical protein [Burkholderiales bacterium 8X]|nr:conserved hypothetical protein [Burkholderiales bacterium 8X]